ncbi:3-deoxy-7-phosphoheptulonate synthase class II [soil metagenome]
MSDLQGSKSRWSASSWEQSPNAQPLEYDDPAALAQAIAELGRLPPLVTSWEVVRLRELIASAQRGERFLLQGGDCAETFDDCSPDIITSKLKILLQMSLVLVHGLRKPVLRIGRFAGQYAKPRTSAHETKGDVSLPAYRGDLVNHASFDARSRRHDPTLLVEAHKHAALTLNFVRSLVAGGFADFHRADAWDMSFFERADLGASLRAEYRNMGRKLREAIGFAEALGEKTAVELARVDFYSSHEGLNLHYEAAQTRTVPHREGYFDLSTHFPWIGERTRQLDGAHVEFFRGIENPVGVKIGPRTTEDELAALLDVLDPKRTPGKIVLITRFGADAVARVLPPLVERARKEARPVLWVSDPMHGNTTTTASGAKTRDFDQILLELERSIDVHSSIGSVLGGVHFELTGEDVTECIGGGLREEDLDRNYASLCDPRLNYRQSLEMAFRLAKKLSPTS